jgi:DNA-binding NarL/FixJ family response regulator
MSVHAALTVADDPPMKPSADPPALLRVVVVDGDDRVCESLARLLCIDSRVETVGNAGRADEALALVRATLPDVVVIDPRLPDIDAGLRLIERLRSIAPDARLLVVVGAAAVARPDLAAAADRIVRKTYRTDELIAAVMAVAGPAEDGSSGKAFC